MELKDFIRHTLVSIKEGVRSANEDLLDKENKVLGEDRPFFSMMTSSTRDSHSFISFDVAVTVNEEKNKSKSGGIKIAMVDIGGGTESIKSQESISRIKFSVRPFFDIT